MKGQVSLGKPRAQGVCVCVCVCVGGGGGGVLSFFSCLGPASTVHPRNFKYPQKNWKF